MDDLVDGVEIVCTDGLFIKQMLIKQKNVLVPQHKHKYPHHSMLAAGSVRVWCDGEYKGDYTAPKAIFIKENSWHEFLSLEPNTIIYCIHRIDRTGEVEVLEMRGDEYALGSGGNSR